MATDPEESGGVLAVAGKLVVIVDNKEGIVSGPEGKAGGIGWNAVEVDGGDACGVAQQGGRSGSFNTNAGVQQVDG